MLKHMHRFRAAHYFSCYLIVLDRILIQCQIILCFRSCNTQLTAMFLFAASNINVLHMAVLMRLAVSVHVKNAARLQKHFQKDLSQGMEDSSRFEILHYMEPLCLPFLSFIFFSWPPSPLFVLLFYFPLMSLRCLKCRYM